MVLRLIRALPGETRLCCHRPCDAESVVTSATMRKRIARGTCIGAPGPQDFAVRRIVSRLAQKRLTVRRPSHPAPNVRDDREAPLVSSAGRAKDRSDLPDNATPIGMRHIGTTGN